jgi:type II secretion system protein D
VLKLYYAIGVLLAAAALAFAQESAELSPPTEIAPPEQNPGAIAAASPAQQGMPAVRMPRPSGASTPVRLQYPNSDVADVLRLYETLTGTKLVMDNFVQGKININLTKEVPAEEAIKIIEMNLLMNGFSLVPAGGDIVKVIGTGKNPRTAGIPVISDESDIPSGEHVISYLFKLRYADPTELQQVLSQYLSPPQPYTSFLALPKSGSLLVTENTAVIRKLVSIIDQVDIAPAEVVSEFIKLERADATKVVDLLNQIFEKGQQQNPQQPGAPQPVGNVRGVRVRPNINPENMGAELSGLTALTEDSIVVGKIKLTADVRTNRIHVVTRPINMPFIRKLIGEFDANVEFAKPVTRPLRYVSAGDILPVLVQALTEPGEEGGAGGPGQGGVGNQQQQQQPQQRRNQTNTNNPYSSTSGTSGEGGSLNVSEELSTEPVDTTPKAVTVGNSKLIADQRANAIVILGNREVVVKVLKILDEMDVKAPQVALSTVIGELHLTNDEELGVDYFVKYKGKVVGFSRNTSVPIPLPGASTAPSASPILGTGVVDPANLVNFSQIIQSVAGGASGTNVYVAAGNYLSTIIHALESTGRFHTISRPTVFTSNNKKAIIASGEEVPVPVSSLTNIANGTVVNGTAAVASNIEYKKVALQLEVVPLINSDKEVSLDILQKIDSLEGQQVIDGNSIPTIATRYIRSNVTAASGSTIVLGGLIQEQKNKSISGIPILDKIPYLGAAFRSTSITKDRRELLVLMCPEVTLTKLDLHRVREKAESKTHFGPEIDQGECPDCPPPAGEGKEIEQLPPPDLPAVRDVVKGK